MADNFLDVRPSRGQDDQLDANRAVDPGAVPAVSNGPSQEDLILARHKPKAKAPKLAAQEKGAVAIATMAAVLNNMDSAAPATGPEMNAVAEQAYKARRDTVIGDPSLSAKAIEDPRIAEKQAQAMEAQRKGRVEQEATANEQFANSTFMERMSAAWNGGITPAVVRHFENEDRGQRTDMRQFFTDHFDELKTYSDDDREWLLRADNEADYARIKNRIASRQYDAQTMSRGGYGGTASTLAIGLLAGATDPATLASMVATGGVAAGLRAIGGAAETAAAADAAVTASRAAKGISLAKEATVSGLQNVAFEKLSDVLGENRTAEDYVGAMALGSALHVGMHVALAGAKLGYSAAKNLTIGTRTMDAPDTEGLRAAIKEVGTDKARAALDMHNAGKTPEEIAEALSDAQNKVTQARLNIILARDEDALHLLKIGADDNFVTAPNNGGAEDAAFVAKQKTYEKTVALRQQELAAAQEAHAVASAAPAVEVQADTGKTTLASYQLPPRMATAIQAAGDLQRLSAEDFQKALQVAKAASAKDQAALQSLQVGMDDATFRAGTKLAEQFDSGNLAPYGVKTLDQLSGLDNSRAVASLVENFKGHAGSTDLFTSIKEHSSSKFNSRLAEQLVKMLPENIPVLFGKGFGRSSSKTWLGLYDSAMGTLHFSGSKASYMRAGSRRMDAETVALHEGVHAASTHQMLAGEKGRLTGTAKTGYDRIVALHAKAQEEFAKLGKTDHAHTYALKNAREFITMGLTDPAVRKTLASIADGRKTMWGTFTDSLRRLLRLPKEDESMLGQLLENFQKLEGYTTDRSITFRDEAATGTRAFTAGMKVVGGAEEEAAARVAKAQKNLQRAQERLDTHNASAGVNVPRDEFTVAANGDEAIAAQLRQIDANARKMDISHPIDSSKTEELLTKIPKAGESIASWIRSTGLTLAKSENAIVRGFARLVPEITTGAAGRTQRTGAITKLQLMGHSKAMLHDFEACFADYTEARGGSRIAASVMDGNFAEWQRQVFDEVQRRRVTADKTADAAVDQHIAKAADKLEEFMQFHRDHMVQSKVMGWQALPESSRGYLPQKVDTKLVYEAPTAVQNGLVLHLADQLMQRSDWDSDTARLVAEKYVNRAKMRAIGTEIMDLNMSNPDAGSVIAEFLEQVGMTREQARDIASRRRAGSQGFTRTRLDLDMNSTFTVGEVQYKLGDFFRKDLNSLLESYAHNATGETALTLSGIPGKYGVQLIRQAATVGDNAATPAELAAIDMIVSEMYGRPYGSQTTLSKATGYLKAATFLATMGANGFQQLCETSQIGVHLGIGAALRGIPGLRAMFESAESRAIDKSGFLQSLESIGGRLDAEEHFHLRGDVQDRQLGGANTHEISSVRNLLRTGMNVMQIANLSRAVRRAQLEAVAKEVGARTLRRVINGSKEELGWVMADMGISEDLITRLRADAKNFVEFDQTTGFVSRFDAAGATDHEAMGKLVDSIYRGAFQLIQGNLVGEKGRWAHDDLLSLLTQFRGFAFVAQEKQFARTQANAGTAAALGMMVAQMMAALPIYYARTQWNTVGMADDQRDKYLQNRLSLAATARSLMNYSSMSGMFGEPVNMLTGLLSLGSEAGMSSPFAGLRSADARGGRSTGGLLDNVPSLGLVNRMYNNAADLWHDPSLKNAARMGKTLPYGNHPLLSPMWAEMMAN